MPAEDYSMKTAEAPRFLPHCAILSTAIALLLPVLSGFALLKENRQFWLNSGGWPIWLRELVRFTFYPLLGGEILLLAALVLITSSGLGLGRAKNAMRLITVLLSLWLLAVVTVVAGNNLANLWAGRPLHWHSQ